MFSKFFIDRPIFASVLSIVITMAGCIAYFVLPLALYPPISPPVVQVDCNYPGASAQVVSETVATPIEQQVNGVENMLYMSSQCTNDGTYNLTATFEHGVDLNMAQVMVQNRVALALPMLPDVLKQTGVNVRKKSPDILLVIALNSPSGKYDQLFLSNYAVLQLKDELARLPGVSDVTMLGQRDYSMRVWVDPEKLAARDMTASDVANAIRAQNSQVATGQIGQPPTPRGQNFQVPLDTLGRLIEPEQFADIVVKATADGRIVRLRDVARVELGAKNQDISGKVNGLPSMSLAVFQLPDANALDTADIVKTKMNELAKDFPEGMRYEIRYDTTPYIRESIGEVLKTLSESVILVAIVVLLFLQNWRSAVIPLIAVPVAIIGTLAVLLAMGFSLNNLTLFGLVLAIGIVVDDAIVVVEAVEHHIERGLAPREATIRAMEEVSGPVIAIGLVLSAVFVPCAFITGIVGQFFRQFAPTIATSTIISTFNSLTLSPALAAMLLRPKHDEGEARDVLPRAAYTLMGVLFGWLALGPWLLRECTMLAARPVVTATNSGSPAHGLVARCAGALANSEYATTVIGLVLGAAVGWLAAPVLNRVLGFFFRLFNVGFVRSTNLYIRIIAGMLRVSGLVVVVYAGMLGLTYWGFVSTPSGFIPSQDMGYLLCNVQLPDSASNERSMALLDKVAAIAKDVEGVKFTQAMTGQSMLLSANGSNFGSMFVIMDEYSKRPDPVFNRFFEWFKASVKVLDDHADSIDYSLVTVKTSDKKLGRTGEKDVYADRVHYRLVGPRESDPAPVRWVKVHWGPWLKRRFDRLIGRPSLKARSIVEAGRLETWIEPDKVETRVRKLGLSWTRSPRWGKLVAAARRWVGLEWPKQKSLSGEAIAAEIRRKFAAEVPGAMITVLGPPPVRGVGRAGGFKIMVEDRGDNGSDMLQGQTEALTEALRREKTEAGSPELVGLTSVFRANVPSVYVDVDRKECMTKEVALKDLFDTMRIYLGSLYVNDFNLFGRTWQVVVQAEPRFRNKIDDVRRLKVRNLEGMMVPLGALADVKEINGPLVLTRYNMYPSAPINGAAAPGVSSGEAITKIAEVAEDPRRGLLDSMAYEWTELAFFEIRAGNTAMIVFGFAVVMVFLVLAAQYENWSLPLAVILVVPMCLLSAIIGVKISYQDINIFTQIGFVVLVGLASKNAILIVEFAKMRRDEGETRDQAALDACRLRLRPIIMTSMAFVLGVVPLILGSGAGAEMKRTLGTTVFTGMLGVTAFGIFLTPVFFAVVDRAGSSRLLNATPSRWASDIVLRTLSLGFVRDAVRRPGWAAGSAMPLGTAHAPGGNGHTHGNGDGDGDSNGNGNGRGNGLATPESFVEQNGTESE